MTTGPMLSPEDEHDLDPRRMEARREISDLLRRFSVPRAYAGDYYGDFASRVTERLEALGWTPPEVTQ